MQLKLVLTNLERIKVHTYVGLPRNTRIYTPYMTVYLVISLPKKRIYTMYIYG